MKSLLTFVLTITLTAAASGQRSGVDSLLRAAEKSFIDGRYMDSELGARRALEHKALDIPGRISCERLIATSLIAQGKTQQAEPHFISILKMDPAFEMDPLLTSPKILTVFTETKKQFIQSGTADSSPGHGWDSPASSITYRALLFPGWEQIHKGRVQTGVVLAALGGVSLGTAVATEFLRSSARKDYLAARSPDDIAAKYKIYDRYYRAETYSFVFFALTYVASEIDLLTNHDIGLTTNAAGPAQSSTLTLTLHF